MCIVNQILLNVLVLIFKVMWRLPAPSFSSSSTSTFVPDKHESPTQGPASDDRAVMCMTKKKKIYICMPNIIIQRLTGFYSTFYVWKNQNIFIGTLQRKLYLSRVKLSENMTVLLFTGADLLGICAELVQCTRAGIIQWRLIHITVITVMCLGTYFTFVLLSRRTLI